MLHLPVAFFVLGNPELRVQRKSTGGKSNPGGKSIRIFKDEGEVE